MADWCREYIPRGQDWLEGLCDRWSRIWGERKTCFIIKKALYGLKSSGLRWHEGFADILRNMKFFPCKAEPDIWIRDMNDHYEYIAVYTDDLTIASWNPQAIIDLLQAKPNNLKLKGTGELNFLLGCDYFREDDGYINDGQFTLR